MSEHEPVVMQGNEAIARGLVENGCVVAASYPGTPASEILSSIEAWHRAEGTVMHVEWAINEKVAFEIAYAASQAGLRSATAMKQVGLNVASDPLMSAAYLGTKGGFVVISADDPGPHSSQTEQDSRLMAMQAKIPVLDPSTPAEAREMAGLAFQLSEEFGIPVMLRPTTRVCHACQGIVPRPPVEQMFTADFQKDPQRWAATPTYRFELHRELISKLSEIAAYPATAPRCLNRVPGGRRALVASGVAAAHAREVMDDSNLLDCLSFFQVLQPYPLHTAFIQEIRSGYDEVLVLEETTGVIELQLRDHRRVRGKLSGFVPEAGELSPETIERLLCEFAGTPPAVLPEAAPAAGRRPTLCPGCPHRASFFAIKRAAPQGIFPSDIGCYTLGVNLGGVDTVLCMGAAIGQAAGFYQAYRLSGQQRDIVATIGDSTFFHAGIPPLIDAMAQGARFVVVVLDNATTAMTGNQPTPALATPAGKNVDIASIVSGCGVEFCRTTDPLNLPAFTRVIREALAFSRDHGLAVVIAKSPCLVDRSVRHEERPRPVVDERCTGCRLCVKLFECPALVFQEGSGRVAVDPMTCSGCGVCLHVCPMGAITMGGERS